MLTSRYMTSIKNLPAIMQKIIDGTAPEKFTLAHLRGIGFRSSNDQGIIPLLKDLGFLASDGSPTKRYHDYRDASRSKKVLGEAIREAYEDLFHINENISDKDRPAIEGKFKSAHNVSDSLAQRLAMTFLALLTLADISSTHTKKKDPKKSLQEEVPITLPTPPPQPKEPGEVSIAGLRYNIEIHLPATKDVDVYNAIFKSLREYLFND